MQSERTKPALTLAVLALLGPAVAFSPTFRSAGARLSRDSHRGGQPRALVSAVDGASAAVPVPSRKTQHKSAVVVGGGPVGLATALTLANAPHMYDVTLIETTAGSASNAKYDPTKAFVYNVNARGMSLTRKFPRLQSKLEAHGVPSASMLSERILVVPADPDAPLPWDSARTARPAHAITGYWVPRHVLVRLMSEAIDEHEAERKKSASGGRGSLGKITVELGQECVAIRPTRGGQGGEGEMVLVTTRESSLSATMERQYEARLVIGADGINSKVRQCLADPDSAAQFAAASWGRSTQYAPSQFQVKQWTSPASHMRIKVLQLPPQFEIPDNDGSHMSCSEDIYVFRCRHSGPRTHLSLGLFPMTDNNAVRPTNMATRPDHEIWTLKDGESLRRWFEDAFPRLPFSRGNGEEGGPGPPMVSDAEWGRLAKAEGTRFPHVQYSPGLALTSAQGLAGVALVGDAIHAYPPDIGQGVNSGLADVVALDRSLRGLDASTGKEWSRFQKKRAKDGKLAVGGGTAVGRSLTHYQKRRLPEVKALARLARFGAPYQYKQPHRIDQIRRNLWTANVVLRLLLSKLTLGFVPQAAIVLSQNPDLTFRQVMRRADVTTAGLLATLAAGAVVWGRRLFGA